MDHPTASDVVVIVSANVEWRAVEQLFPDVSPHASLYGKWFARALGTAGRRVVFFHGGWGKIAAAASTEYLIHHAKPKLLVNLGTCGGFAGAIERGTVILVERTVVYDIYEQMGDHDEHLAHYATEIDLDWLGDSYPHAVTRALILSADRDLVVEEIPKLRQQFGGVVGDWESASIAWVARKHGVRTLILRGVSDLVGQQGGEAYDGNLHVFEQNAQAIMDRLVRQLPDWIERSIGI